MAFSKQNELTGSGLDHFNWDFGRLDMLNLDQL